MFGPITIPYECVMLYNTATLKPGIDFDDVELCNLHRQIIHVDSSIGLNKAISAAQSIQNVRICVLVFSL